MVVWICWPAALMAWISNWTMGAYLLRADDFVFGKKRPLGGLRICF
jgi:hypothetical protein